MGHSQNHEDYLSTLFQLTRLTEW